ncbi:MAG: nucleotide sugar dehydrogenase [Ruminococcus sp.]|nr:nucleotide sugar dehydrogenase [Ruminococcus sp.]
MRNVGSRRERKPVMKDTNKRTIAVAGIGYVGMSIATLLSKYNKVILVDTIEEKVNKIKEKKSTVKDEWIEKYLLTEKLDLNATTDAEQAYTDAEYIVIATPTNYDPGRNYFDTASIESVIDIVQAVNPDAIIVIKSTVPIGYTKLIKKKKRFENILFFPEFLREGKALYDNLYPSRIIAGVDMSNNYLVTKAHIFAELLQEAAIKKDVRILFSNTTEAEAVKLFSNTYLAMRVAFFNEIDMYAESNGLNAKQIIEGIGLDSRVGDHYNNPSFGYGGYCLPKDSKQAVASFGDVPNDLIKAIVNSNQTRKAYIAERILEKADYMNNRDAVIGVYRLIMKAGSDNFRESAVKGIIDILFAKGVRILVYEPTLAESACEEYEVENNFEEFIKKCAVIIANRSDENIEKIGSKLYTRDIYSTN